MGEIKAPRNDAMLLHFEQLSLRVYVCPCPVPSVIFVSAADHAVNQKSRCTGALGVNT